MKRLLWICLLAAGSAVAAVPPGDWVLWYDRPAKVWEEALPVGNGRLGAMVHGGTTRETIQFNEHTVWTGHPRCYAHAGAAKVLPELRRLLWEGRQREAEALAMKEFMGTPLRQMAYQPCGELVLEQPAAAVTGHRRWLDLDTGIATTEWTAEGVTFRRETFASHPANLIVTRLSASRAGALSAKLRLASPHRDHQSTAADGALDLTGRVEADGVCFAARAVVTATGGASACADGTISVTGADAIEIRLTAATNVKDWRTLGGDAAAGCERTLAAARGNAHARLLEEHLADHRALFRAVALDLGRTPAAEWTTDRRIADFRGGNDPQLAALLFQYGRYLLIGSSRAGGQPANLQGIWNAQLKPQWDSKYTCNINTQMNYWPAETTGLSSCHEALFAALEELRESGTVTAREHYGAPGWVLHHNFDLWRGTAPINAADHGIWPTGGAWLALHLWERYVFSGDREFLRRAWPVMRGAAEFFTAYLSPDPATDLLVSGPSNSPEHGGLVMGPTMDHQIIRELFRACARAARLLGTEAEFAAKLDGLAGRLAPNKIGRHGQLQEWLADRDDPRDQHRHVSHLWGVFPGADITWRQPELFAAARQSLLHRGDAATGWSMGWKINLWARFLDGDHALRILTNLMQPVGRTQGQGGLYPNLFDAHPPFQIDGNFGATAGIAEMLLQSQVPVVPAEDEPRFVVHLLPALPAAWRAGSVRGLRARGGLAVDMFWQDGRLVRAVLTPARDGPVTVRCGAVDRSFAGRKGVPLVVLPP